MFLRMSDELCSLFGDQQIFDAKENLELLLEDIDELQSVIAYNKEYTSESEMRTRGRLYILHVYQPMHLHHLLERALASDTEGFICMFSCWCIAIRQILDHTV